MTPRPLYRSISFWSGILVIGFMAWAWWASYHHLSIASYGRVEAAHAAGGLALTVQEGRFRPGVSSQEGLLKVRYGKHGEWIYDGVMPGDSAALFPPLRSYSGVYDVSGAVFLPHWLMMLAFAVVWLLGLVYLQRRKSSVPKPGTDGSSGAWVERRGGPA